MPASKMFPIIGHCGGPGGLELEVALLDVRSQRNKAKETVMKSQITEDDKIMFGF